MRTNTLSSREIYRPAVMQLPQVLHGVVSESQAEVWLDRVCKSQPANRVAGLISQQAGIGADDMRALVAYGRNEYHPNLSPNEVMQRKWLDVDSFKYKPANATKMLFINMARELLSERYAMPRDRDLESHLAAPKAGSWKIGRPALALRGSIDLLIDIQFEESVSAAKSFSKSDAVRLHHYDLVAAERGISNTELLLVKVAVDPGFMNAVSALAAASENVKSALARNASSLRGLDPGLFTIHAHRVEKDKRLYPEILEAGSQAWSNVLEGRSYDIRLDQALSLSEEREAEYRMAAQEFCAAETVFRAAKESSEEAKGKLIQTAQSIGIHGNHKPVFAGAEVRSYDRFDKIGAAHLLETTYGINRSILCDHTYDADAMAAALKDRGVDPARYRRAGEYNKDKIVDAAEQLNIDLSEYKSRELRALFSRKTRGPIFEALDRARKQVEAPVRALQRDLLPAINSNPEVADTPSPKRKKGLSPT